MARRATPDEVVDTCMRILQREALRLEAKPELRAEEIDLVVRVARASTEVMQIMIDPLGPAGRKRVAQMAPAEIKAAIRRLEAQALPPIDGDRGDVS